MQEKDINQNIPDAEITENPLSEKKDQLPSESTEKERLDQLQEDAPSENVPGSEEDEWEDIPEDIRNIRQFREKQVLNRKRRAKQVRMLWFILAVTVFLSVLTIVYVGTRLAGTIGGGQDSSRKSQQQSEEGNTVSASDEDTSQKKEKAASEKAIPDEPETSSEKAGSASEETGTSSEVTETSSEEPETSSEKTGTSSEEKTSSSEKAQTGETKPEEEGESAESTSSEAAEEERPRPVPTAELRTHPEDEVWLTASGDNLIHQRLYEQAAQRSGDGTYDFSYAYEMITPFISQHDLNWIDIETLVNSTIEPSGYPEFSTPGENGQALLKAGFNVFSLASNHTYDYGAEGIAATSDYWTQTLPESCLATGLWTNDSLDQIPVMITEQGYTVAFLTYLDFTNLDPEDEMPERVIYLSETELIEQQVRLAAELADAVVVSCHWGEEGSHEISDDQRYIAQNMANWGADIIIGDHPHVIQDAEWLTAEDGRDVFCVYSLGNLVSTQEQPDELIGQILEVTLRFTEGEQGRQLQIADPVLVPIVTIYGKDAADSRVMLYRDVLDEELENHGVRKKFPKFGREYIEKVLRDNISSEFLQLPEREEKEETAEKDSSEEADDTDEGTDKTEETKDKSEEIKDTSEKTEDTSEETEETSEEVDAGSEESGEEPAGESSESGQDENGSTQEEDEPEQERAVA